MDFAIILHESLDPYKNTIEIKPLYFICETFSSCILWDKKEYVYKDTKYNLLLCFPVFPWSGN